ncbi:TetR/AcrR family transcriptional regulator [Alkalihalobacillus pseudalcaliphilus]|uniref:TetR/AcrR family transcriptional regulator n=1 Tax=Alkalihalobacillus pseudalcaliphilus TaxID=79884 RepID=UPI00064DBD72|nr:TetR/AcrR family transcriptional regulator [Alkalihalobacillus pseudalcaliphilus]KMK75202.1 TetR family transcriptional regulator [Alkalihalobacillus pseudalcaliphilus]
MNGFEKRKELKKKNIIEAAFSLYMTYGIQKVSIKEIADQANVSQVTIYNYFESKENLTQIVFKHFVDLAWEEQKQLLDIDLPFKDKVEKIIFTKSDLTEQMTEPFFRDFMLDYSSGKSYVEKLYIEEGLPRLVKLFQDGKKQGVVDASISDEAILLYLQMFKEFMQREDIATALLPISEDFTKLFFYGVTGDHKKTTDK